MATGADVLCGQGQSQSQSQIRQGQRRQYLPVFDLVPNLSRISIQIHTKDPVENLMRNRIKRQSERRIESLVHSYIQRQRQRQSQSESQIQCDNEIRCKSQIQGGGLSAAQFLANDAASDSVSQEVKEAYQGIDDDIGKTKSGSERDMMISCIFDYLRRHQPDISDSDDEDDNGVPKKRKLKLYDDDRVKCKSKVEEGEEDWLDLERRLVEVFGVKIKNHNGNNVFGTVTVDDGMFNHILYEHESENSQTIIVDPCEDNNLLLTGPTRDCKCIVGFNNIRIKLDLSLIDSSKTMVDEIKETFGWSSEDINEYHIPLHKELTGKNGMTATVYYARYVDAISAHVEVTLIKGSPFVVCGVLATRNDIFNFDEDYESVLFKDYSGEGKRVGPSDPILLSRSIVAMPLHSDFIVRVDLYNPCDSSDTIKGTAKFRAKPFCESEEHNITSNTDRTINVKVSWANFWLA